MSRRSTTSPPVPLPARVWGVAGVVGVGALLGMLDSTLVNLAVEAVRDDLRTSLQAVQWIVTGYLIALAVSLPASGWLGARFGHGRVWAVSLAVFVAASALCALAPGVAALVAARVLQGLAAGLMMPAGQAVIGSIAGPGQLGRLFGVLGLVLGVGPAIGPAAGGLLLQAVSWRWLFWLNVPIGVAALVAARRLVPGGARDEHRALDVCGLVLLGVGMPLALYSATDIGTRGVTAVAAAVVVAGLLLTAVFAVRAVSVAAPLIDLRLLRTRAFAAATVTTGFTCAAMYGGLLVLPLYLQLQLGWGSAGTGAALLVMGAGSAVALYVGGVLTDRYGAGPVAAIGAVVLVASTVPFLVPASMPAPVLLAVLVARGVGLAWAQMPATTAAYEAAGAERIGDASTLVNIVQRVGGALGVAGLVVVLSRTAGDHAYVWAFAVLTVLAMSTVVFALILWRNAAIERR
ncbi:EmrB/QacA subfamily drug resistance transporter [Lentzea atacamensis]|uniref:EmrB/QacA subfamily drug resistance transporter n=1 Tax=Lentzea atacamensis TaxID=531938 RepID=A0A316IAQ5_9PSEU|nr:DHA2 family efflux MFS transporter permease subunit [Lentzea atacamensis]PWK89546.1 EmrB/QacA subfamily drug resistance transporter [Lentzea atacamensis]